MKTKLIKMAFVALAAISFSCSSDSDNTTQNTGMFLNKTEAFLPQRIGFTSRTVSYYENNKIICDTAFNNSGVMTSRREYISTASSSTTNSYNAQNVLLSKYVFQYDSAKRITGITGYNGQNILQSETEYEYIGHDINLYKIENANRVLKSKFKTNNDDLVYYQEMVASDETRTLTYWNDLPVEMNQEGFIFPFEFYPNMKPQNLQNSTNEINNAALSLVLDHVYFSCNYYLKKVINLTNNTTMHHEKTFNSDNYITYQKGYYETSGVFQNAVETFYYYNE